MAEEAGEKKHEATPYRRQKAREEGQIARSQDLGSAVLLLAGIFVLQFTGSQIFETLAGVLKDHLEVPYYWTTDTSSILNHLLGLTYRVSLVLAPLFGVVFLTAIVINLAQGGLLWLPDKLGFDFNRINPLAGFGRIFSLSNGTRLGFGLLKMSLIAATLIMGVWSRWGEIMGLSDMPIARLDNTFGNRQHNSGSKQVPSSWY